MMLLWDDEPTAAGNSNQRPKFPETDWEAMASEQPQQPVRADTESKRWSNEDILATPVFFLPKIDRYSSLLACLGRFFG